VNKKKTKTTRFQARTSSIEKPSWTFFTNHAHVLIVLKMYPNMVLREIAFQVGITERGVQKIIAELEDEGFIKKLRVGRQNKYKLTLNHPLRHPIEKHRTVADIVGMIVKD
jgi:DNA-binding MarR family transcriptional regulator